MIVTDGQYKRVVNSELTTRIINPLFGFEYEARWRHYDGNFFSTPGETARRQFNIIRCTGYFPYLNIIVIIGLLGLSAYVAWNAIANNHFDQLLYRQFLNLPARAILTFLFGPFLLPLDIGKYLVQEYALNSVKN